MIFFQLTTGECAHGDKELSGTITYSSISPDIPAENAGELGDNGNPWSPVSDKIDEYIRVSFDQTQLITAVRIGGDKAVGFVSKYQIQYTTDEETWTTVQKTAGNDIVSLLL